MAYQNSFFDIDRPLQTKFWQENNNGVYWQQNVKNLKPDNIHVCQP